MAERTLQTNKRFDFAEIRRKLERAGNTSTSATNLQEVFRERALLLATPSRSSDETTGTEHLRFFVAEVRFAVPLEDIHCLSHPGAVAHIPGANAHLAHVIHVEGRIIPVLDMAPLIGHAPLAIETLQRSRMLVLRRGVRVLATAVGACLEVFEIDPSKLTPSTKGTWMAEASRGVTSDLTNVLDVSRLMDRLSAFSNLEPKERCP